MKAKRVEIIVVLLMSFFCMNLEAQTVIREKVKIKPSPSLQKKLMKTTDGYLPCGPWPTYGDSITATQVEWAGTTMPIDPGQQPLWGQGNIFMPYTRVDNYYNIDVITGETLVEFYELTPDSLEDGVIIREGTETKISPHLVNVLGIEIRGDGYDWAQTCYSQILLAFKKYIMKIKPGVEGMFKIRYVTGTDSFFVETHVVKPRFHLDYSGQTDSTYHNYEHYFAPDFAFDYCPNCSAPDVNKLCTYTIIAGNEFGTLYNKAKKENGEEVEGLPSETYFIANGVNPATEGLVTIRVTPYEDVSPVDITFKVKNYNGITPGINVSFSKNELAAGDTVDILIKKYYASSETESGFAEMDFNWGTTFEVGVLEGCEIGEILTSDGRRGSYFRDLQLPVKFIVYSTITADSALMMIRAAADEPEGMATKIVSNGSSLGLNINRSLKASTTTTKTKRVAKVMASCSNSEFYLGNFRTASAAVANAGGDDIKITMTLTGPSEIWPSNTNGNPLTNVKVTVTKDSKPFANQNIKLTILRTEGTGGHSHESPKLDDKKCGLITLSGLEDNPNTNGETDNNGEITTEKIVSSEFGGDYFLEAVLSSYPDIKCEIPITVKVQGLELLANSIYYDQIGGTSKHHGPPNYSENENHYGTSELNATILNLSRSWYNTCSNVPRLQINDMSLINGGLFDLNGLWSTASGHKSHRIGENVDIQSSRMYGERFYDKNKNGWYDSDVDTLFDNNNNGKFDPGQLNVFRNMAIQKNFKTVNYETEPVTKQPHWHLDLRKRGLK